MPANNTNQREAARSRLAAALDEDPGGGSVVLSALSAISRAKGMAPLAREIQTNRAGLQCTLSASGNPFFTTVLKVVRALGLRLRVEIDHHPSSDWAGSPRASIVTLWWAFWKTHGLS